MPTCFSSGSAATHAGHGGLEVGAALFPNDLPLPMLMHTLVLSWASIIMVTFVLGMAGVLTGLALMLGVDVLATAALLVSRLMHQPASLVIPAFTANSVMIVGWTIRGVEFNPASSLNGPCHMWGREE